MELLSNFSAIPFYLVSAAVLICSLGMIFNKNIVRAGFLLIGSFAAVAGLYFMLSANFVAISQILIYAVGITLVVIFAIMLCSLKEAAGNMRTEEDVDDLKPRKMWALLVAVGLFGLLTYVILSQDWSYIATLTGADLYSSVVPEISAQYTSSIGNSMMTDYLLPFELVSVLLLIVLVGVIILSKKQLD